MKNLIPRVEAGTGSFDWVSVIRSSTVLILPVISNMVLLAKSMSDQDHLQVQAFLESVVLTNPINNKTKLVQ